MGSPVGLTHSSSTSAWRPPCRRLSAIADAPPRSASSVRSTASSAIADAARSRLGSASRWSARRCAKAESPVTSRRQAPHWPLPAAPKRQTEVRPPRCRGVGPDPGRRRPAGQGRAPRERPPCPRRRAARARWTPPEAQRSSAHPTPPKPLVRSPPLLVGCHRPIFSLLARRFPMPTTKAPSKMV